MLKDIYAYVLENFKDRSLEERKKASALFGVMSIVTLMGTVVFLSEIFAGFPLQGQIPGLWMSLGFALTLFFLRQANLDLAQLSFLTAFLLVISSIPFLDPYDNPFELYRYTFLVSGVLALSGLFLRRRWHIVVFTLVVVAGILAIFFLRIVLPGVLPLDTVVILTLVVCLVISTLIGGVAILNLTIQKELLTDVEEKEAQALRQRDSFARFVPQEFLKLLNKNDVQNLSLGEGIQRAGTVMMLDIRDFTGISEHLSPREVMGFLNEWLEVAAPVILKHRGIIDKFMGDGILVLFPHAVEDALGASLELISALEGFNTHRVGLGKKPIEIGIGINFGELILGTIGHATRMDSTVVSDAVNTAAHLESLTKFYQSPLIISRNALYETLNPNHYTYRFLDTVKIKNRQEPVQVFEVLDALPEARRNLILQTKDQFEEALECYLLEEFTLAHQKFQELVELNPLDTPARIYLDRCQTLLNKIACEDK